jgi:hypothetical protein
VTTYEDELIQAAAHGDQEAFRLLIDVGEAENLMLTLNYQVTYVYIYRWQMDKDIELFDMRLA